MLLISNNGNHLDFFGYDIMYIVEDATLLAVLIFFFDRRISFIFIFKDINRALELSSIVNFYTLMSVSSSIGSYANLISEGCVNMIKKSYEYI